jgi:hypothetical protein
MLMNYDQELQVYHQLNFSMQLYLPKILLLSLALNQEAKEAVHLSLESLRRAASLA